MLTVAEWNAAGIIHGFLGRELDLRSRHEEDLLGALGQVTGVKIRRLCLLRQVHGVKLVEVSDQTVAEGVALESIRPEGDGWVIYPSASADVAGSAFGISTADCTPVLIYHPHSGLRAALHCGWRSTVAGLLPRALARIAAAGGAMREVQLAIGPGARSCCYEVGEEVVEQIEPRYRERSVVERANGGNKCSSGVGHSGRFLAVDELLVAQAEAAGVQPEHIFRFDICTICSGDYFSYRRELDSSGRQLSFVGGLKTRAL